MSTRNTAQTGMILIVALIGLTACSHLRTNGDARRADSLKNGLVAYYAFDGNANDSSENGIDGRVHGATLTEDGSGNKNSAYLFDGLNDYIMFGQVLPDMSEMTVCARVFAENDVNFFNDADWAGGNDVTLGVGASSVNVRADKGNDSLRETLDVGVKMHRRWSHIAWTLTAQGSNVYIDGSHGAMATRGGANVAFHNFILGSHEYPQGNMGFGGYWKGAISSLRIYNRVLSNAEIREVCERDD